MKPLAFVFLIGLFTGCRCQEYHRCNFTGLQECLYEIGKTLDNLYYKWDKCSTVKSQTETLGTCRWNHMDGCPKKDYYPYSYTTSSQDGMENIYNGMLNRIRNEEDNNCEQEKYYTKGYDDWKYGKKDDDWKYYTKGYDDWKYGKKNDDWKYYTKGYDDWKYGKKNDDWKYYTKGYDDWKYGKKDDDWKYYTKGYDDWKYGKKDDDWKYYTKGYDDWKYGKKDDDWKYYTKGYDDWKYGKKDDDWKYYTKGYDDWNYEGYACETEKYTDCMKDIRDGVNRQSRGPNTGNCDQMRSFVRWYKDCSKWFHYCEEGRTADYWSMQELGNSVIYLLTDRENEACSGDGRYYSMSAGVKQVAVQLGFFACVIFLSLGMMYGKE